MIYRVNKSDGFFFLGWFVGWLVDLGWVVRVNSYISSSIGISHWNDMT
jgi:hypothetical protein